MTKQIDTTKAVTIFALSTLISSGCLFTQDPMGDGVGVTPSQDMGIIPTQDMPADQSESQDLGDTPDEGIAPDDLGSMPDLSTPDDMNQDMMPDMNVRIVCGNSECRSGEWCDERNNTAMCLPCPESELDTPICGVESTAFPFDYRCNEQEIPQNLKTQCNMPTYQRVCTCPDPNASLNLEYSCNMNTLLCDGLCVTTQIETDVCSTEANRVQAMCPFGIQNKLCAGTADSDEQVIGLRTGVEQSTAIALSSLGSRVHMGNGFAVASADPEFSTQNLLRIYEKKEKGNWVTLPTPNLVADIATLLDVSDNDIHHFGKLAAINNDDILIFSVSVLKEGVTHNVVLSTNLTDQTRSLNMIGGFYPENSIHALNYQDDYITILTENEAHAFNGSETYSCDTDDFENVSYFGHAIGIIRNTHFANASMMVFSVYNKDDQEYQVFLCTNTVQIEPTKAPRLLNSSSMATDGDTVFYQQLNQTNQIIAQSITISSVTLSDGIDFEIPVESISDFSAKKSSSDYYILASGETETNSSDLVLIKANDTSKEFTYFIIPDNVLTNVSVSLPDKIGDSSHFIMGQPKPGGSGVVHFGTKP